MTYEQFVKAEAADAVSKGKFIDEFSLSAAEKEEIREARQSMTTEQRIASTLEKVAAKDDAEEQAQQSVAQTEEKESDQSESESSSSSSSESRSYSDSDSSYSSESASEEKSEEKPTESLAEKPKEEIVPAKGAAPEQKAEEKKPEPSIHPTGKDIDAYNLQKASEKPDTEDRDKFGKNSKGQYLNHQAFVAHRNLLNEEEAKNVRVFDVIQDKLSDADYLTQVMDPGSGSHSFSAQGVDSPDIDDNLQLESKALSSAQMQTMLGTTMTMEAMGSDDDEDAADLGEVEGPELEPEDEEDEDPEEQKGPSAQDWPDDKMPTDYQAQCYMERYKDLGHILGGFDLTKAKMHWMEKGRYEGRWLAPCGLGKANKFTQEQTNCFIDRYPMNAHIVKQAKKGPEKLQKGYEQWARRTGFNRFCAPRITFWQSYCMLARSPDLESQFGAFLDKHDVTDFRLMRYWQKFGYFEGRDADCSEFGGDFYKCANPGEDCSCPHGQVYFGRPGKKGVTFTAQRMLEESHQWIDTRNLADPEAPLKCDKTQTLGFEVGDRKSENFILGPVGGNNYACYCQSLPKKLFKPLKCAEEGGECQCKGNVFYGVAGTDGMKAYDTFRALVENPYAVKNNRGHANLTCIGDNFSAGYPLAGTSKDCYCDQYYTYEEEDIQADQDQFLQRYQIYQQEQQMDRIRAQKQRYQATARQAASRAQTANTESQALKTRYREEAVARQQAAWEAKDAELAAARERKAAAEMAAQDREQAAEKTRMEKSHANELARKAAEAQQDQAQHDNSMARIQARIDAQLRMAEVEAEQDRIDAEARKAEQDAKEARILARAQAAQEEEAALIAQKEAYEEATRLEAERQEALAEADNAREQLAARESAEAAELQRTQDAVAKAIAAAIAEQQKREEARIAAFMAQEQAKAADRERKKKAKDEAELKERERKANEKLRLEQEEADAKARAKAAQDSARAQFEAERDENIRLEKEKREARAAEDAARAELIQAQKEEALARSKDDRDAAAAKAAKQQALLDAKEAEVRAAEDKQAALEQNIAQLRMGIAAAQAEERDALAALQEAEEQAHRDEVRHTAAVALAASQKAEEDRKKAAHEAKIVAERQANQQKLAQMAAQQEAEQAAAHAAAELAHQQAIAARQAQENRQIALHAQLLAERKSKMQAQYDHLWISGDPGLVVATMVFEDSKKIDELKTHLYYYNIVAEMWTVKSGISGIERIVSEDHKMIKNEAEHRVVFVTTQPRVPELLSVTERILGNNDFDMVMTSPKSGNRYYMEWVKEQTLMPGQANVALENFGID